MYACRRGPQLSAFWAIALPFWMLLARSGPRSHHHNHVFCQAFQYIGKRISHKIQSIHNQNSFFRSMVALEQQGDSSSNHGDKSVEARLIPLDQLEDCGERLRSGNLVAFPTETVYGLGCNALDPKAIMKVFAAKERPLTDPLITHVTDPQVAFDLWSADEDSVEGKALSCLCRSFWPGPLTLVARAADHVPATLMANTGYVACRAPRHPISIKLINAAKVPIAAPSANKFGHVSPTRAHHVWDDLKYEDVWIIETDTTTTNSICEVGVESSVAKVEMLDSNQGRILLLRQGAISVADIQKCLNEAGLSRDFVVEAKTKKATGETVANVAPGQTIRHYSPDIPSYILSLARCEASSKIGPEDLSFLAKTVVIDFGGKLSDWKNHAKAYRDLSAQGSSAEATNAVFETLRWAERVSDAEQIIFPEILETKSSGSHESADALTLALKDRLTRAASGVVIETLQLKIDP